MFRASALITLAVLLVNTLPLQGQQQSDFLGLQRRITELYEEYRHALVRVKAVYDQENEDDVPQVVIGSGFFISREGLVLTNASIVYRPVRVWVEHKDIAYSADVIGVDQATNLALLRVHTLPRNFRFFHLVDSPDVPPIGSFVLRLSMPLEFPVTPEWGLISGHESRFGERYFPCLYFRTSIAAGPGDGGSAYLDLSGRLLGIQVGSLPDIGSSYMLPSRAALRIRDDLLFSEEVNFGWIGFEIRERSSIEMGRQVILEEVFDDTPAERSGLRPGDVLIQIGDYPISTLDDLRNAMFYTRVGQYSQVRIMRDGENHEFSVRVAKRPDDEPLEIQRDPGMLIVDDSPLRNPPVSSNASNEEIEEDDDEKETAGSNEMP
jgi:S1-C subfamily serine protease